MHKKPPKKFKKTKHKATQDSKSTNPIQKAILDTLKYRQIFDCSASYYQIWNYLISDKPTDPRTFKTVLDDLAKAKKIICQDGWYSIGKVDYTKAEKRREHAEKLMTQASSVVKYLKQIPWIEMAAVTGSVAASNAGEQSDIDMLVVTKPKRLWLTRLFLVSTLKVLGVYWSAKKPAGTICPNILLTIDNLTWDVEKQNLYTANEVSLLYPIFFRHNCYFDFLQKNDWVKNYLHNFNCHFKIADTSVASIRPPEQKPVTASVAKQAHHNFVDLIELVTMKLQMLYMKNKKTTEVVSEGFIHFNTHDSTPTILQKFQSSTKTD